MSRLTILKISFRSAGVENVIYPVIISDGNEFILIDCGYPACLPILQQAATDNGIDLSQLTKVIITHHDFDHMGALAGLKRTYPNSKVLASAQEERYISGKQKSLRLEQAEAIYDTLPEDRKQAAKQFQRVLEEVETAEVDQTLNDGDIFPWCGGIEIIATPGHMPGHISIYHIESKTLIAGDALVAENGELAIANPQYTIDMMGAKKSIKKLLDYEIDTLICYHGGIVTREIKAALQKISTD
ncbi:putative metallo-hydrolase YflN [Sporomusa rhizae]|uniref:MBL fold metallo-hydrolase n=1 Tax=Sporomusa rhizae TaxID=357999 RepID=UPI00352BAC00